LLHPSQLVGEEQGGQIIRELDSEGVRWTGLRRQCKPKSVGQVDYTLGSFKGAGGRGRKRGRKGETAPWIRPA
jgi:hypothetical protein